MGNFNKILDMEEHSLHTLNPTITHGMYDFQSVVRHCNLLDLGSHGPLCTWTNKRAEGLISKSWINYWLIITGMDYSRNLIMYLEEDAQIIYVSENSTTSRN